MYHVWRELFVFSAKHTHTHTHYFLPVLSCCVVCVFSRTDLEILTFSAHLFSFPDFYLNIFRNMLSSGFEHSVKQKALWKTDQCWNHIFQRSQILDELIPPAHTESSVTFSSRSAPAGDSVVNLLYHLANHLSRGFLSVDDQFRARRLKWQNFQSMVSRPQEQEAEVAQIQEMWYLEVLVFSYVNLSFWWDTLLLFLLFWILVIVVFSYTLFILCHFETKMESIFCFEPGMYFQTGQVFFIPEWPNGEFVSILFWQHSSWQKHFM